MPQSFRQQHLTLRERPLVVPRLLDRRHLIVPVLNQQDFCVREGCAARVDEVADRVGDELLPLEGAGDDGVHQIEVRAVEPVEEGGEGPAHGGWGGEADELGDTGGEGWVEAHRQECGGRA